jgi:phospholipid/cholesterol/gamma-HCH transport system substrate-binding protein
MSSAMRRFTGILFSSRTLMLGALAAAAVAGSAFLGSGGGHQVVARFSDADGLVAGNEIRVAGIESGGTVQSVEVQVDPSTGQQDALVTLNIDDSHWPLHKGTTFAVRPKGVLSNMYVAMSPGNADNPVLDSGHVFGLAETSSPINLDEFSNLFTKDVTESIRTQIQEGVIAFGGSGADNTNALIHNLNPLTADLSPITSVLAQRSPELDRLNSEFDTVTRELSSEDANLRGLIQNGNTFLATLAQNATAVQGTLVHATGTLTTIDQALQGEQANLQAIFEKGPAALDKARQFSDLFVPIINTVNPKIPDLQQLLVQFLSATGYPTTDSNGHPVIASRIDATIGGLDGIRSAVPCGGQWWGAPPCPYPPAAYGGTSTPPHSSSSSSGSSPATGTAQGTQSSEVPSMYGGLFQ